MPLSTKRAFPQPYWLDGDGELVPPAASEGGLTLRELAALTAFRSLLGRADAIGRGHGAVVAEALAAGDCFCLLVRQRHAEALQP